MKKTLLIILLVSLLVGIQSVYAFPDSVGIIDTFVRADSGTLGVNWTQKVDSDETCAGLELKDNGAQPLTSSSNCSAYYNADTFGPNLDVWTTQVRGGSPAGRIYYHLVDAGTGSPDGYYVEWSNAADFVRIRRIDNGTPTTICTFTVTPVTGDSIGVSYRDGVHRAWLKVGAGAWTEQCSATDVTYPLKGNVGLHIFGASGAGGANVAPFAGGTVAGLTRALMGVGQ